MPTTLKTAYATYPAAKLKGFKTDAKTKKKKFGILKELLFGDRVVPYFNGSKYESITVVERKKDVQYIKVRARGIDGYLKETEFQEKRILEVNFIDVGQGDGCHIATPDDKHFIIDAGPKDNMYRFLKWRFNLATAKVAPPPFTVVVSHSDADHYKGFDKIFSLSKGTKQQFSINKIYHNGIVEYTGTPVSSLGKVIKSNGQDYLTDLCETNAAYKKRAKVAKPGNYIKVLNMSKAPKVSLDHKSKPIYKNGNLKIEVVGPVTKKISGKNALPVFDSNKGKTKNGHSVILKLTIGYVRILLGGDLNSDAENYILEHYTKVNIADIKKKIKLKSTTNKEREALEKKLEKAIQAARSTFEVEVAKSCHHGSGDFTSEFLKALNPLATVVSSGDEEPHTHPRPDTLGTIGKHSRGERSLIFCTELARSSKEFVELKKNLNTEKKREKVVTVYGMINVRTDGDKIVIAQKLERKAAGRDWDVHTLDWNDTLKQYEYKQYLKYEK